MSIRCIVKGFLKKHQPRALVSCDTNEDGGWSRSPLRKWDCLSKGREVEVQALSGRAGTCVFLGHSTDEEEAGRSPAGEARLDRDLRRRAKEARLYMIVPWATGPSQTGQRTTEQSLQKLAGAGHGLPEASEIDSAVTDANTR